MHWANQDVRRRFLACFSNAELMSIVQSMHLKLGRAYSVTATTMHKSFPWNDVALFIQKISKRSFSIREIERLDVFQIADIIKQRMESWPVVTHPIPKDPPVDHPTTQPSEPRSVKDRFLDQFTDDELWHIVQLFKWKKWTREPHLLTQDRVRENFPWNHIRPFAFKVATGRFPATKGETTNIAVILDHIAKFKQWVCDEFNGLRPSEPHVIRREEQLPEPPSLPPKFNGGCQITHPKLGVICVTRHAWIRFHERFDKRRFLTADKLRLRIESSFARATSVPISTKTRIHRCINNDFVFCRYFYNEEEGVRFILAKDSNTILTVEHPVNW